ncbi:uncharacterized protein, partial [Littorina saxatilis]|uniref:uncharacterized protein n=1 Tax=Littorina saxatilis TaxID=31220 RepID=UPI0038B59731
METVRPHLAFLCLLVLLPTLTTAVSFRLEAENAARPHQINWRSKASNHRTVHVISTLQFISFPVCLYRQLSANITVTYSNDGGSDDVRVKVDDDTQNLQFSSVEASSAGAFWEVFRSTVFRDVTLQRGYNQLTLSFEKLDTYGIEIDYVDVSVDDAFITEDVFHCKLVLGAEPTFSANEDRGVCPGYVQQHSYVTPCAEEDNVHLAVHHEHVQKYTLSASNPLYRSIYDIKDHDFTACTNFESTYWRFEDVSADDIEDDVITSPLSNKANLTGQLLQNDAVYNSKVSVWFTLKGFKTGFVDADIHSDLQATFSLGDAPSSNVKITYEGRSGQEVLLDEFSFNDRTVTKAWTVPELTWSEDRPNFLHIYVSNGKTTLKKVELVQGHTGPDTALDIFSSDSVFLQGVRSDFWWRRPVGESLTVKVRDHVFTNLSRVALYVPVPWSGQGSFHQILVLYQDGNARLVPVPYAAPIKGHWTPFGTSTIIGKSNPADL